MKNSSLVICIAVIWIAVCICIPPGGKVYGILGSYGLLEVTGSCCLDEVLVVGLVYLVPVLEGRRVSSEVH